MSDPGFREQLNDPAVLPGIPGLSERAGEITHMCPEGDCMHVEAGVYKPNPFCPVCLGAGIITSERLARYQLFGRP